MPIFFSIVLRTVYLCSILFVASALGVAVAMGFDSGINIGASLIALLYLFTFIPALLLSFTPLTYITHPPFVLKIWYWWIGLICVVFLAFRIFWFFKVIPAATSEIYDRIAHKDNYGTICREVINAEPNAEVWMAIGNLKKGAFRYNAIVGKRLCESVNLSKAPFQVLLGGPDAVAVFDIPVSGRGKTCIGLSPAYKGASSQGTAWSVEVIDCSH